MVVTAGSWLFPRLTPDGRRIMRLEAGLTMSSARSRMKLAARPNPGWPCRVPAGTPFSAERRIPSDLSWDYLNSHAFAAGHGWKGMPLRHIAWSTTASLRATATAACLKPMRFTRSRPHVFKAESCRTRTKRLAAASNR